MNVIETHCSAIIRGGDLAYEVDATGEFWPYEIDACGGLFSMYWHNKFAIFWFWASPKGFEPCKSTACGSAPFSRSNLTISVYPLAAAIWSGVRPNLSNREQTKRSESSLKWVYLTFFYQISTINIDLFFKLHKKFHDVNATLRYS